MSGEAIAIIVLGFSLAISVILNLIQDTKINQLEGYIGRMGWRTKKTTRSPTSKST